MGGLYVICLLHSTLHILPSSPKSMIYIDAACMGIRSNISRVVLHGKLYVRIVYI